MSLHASLRLYCLAAVSFSLLLLSLSACTSVKKISEYKLADKPETAAKNIEKSLKYLLEESDSADYRAQLYDSISFLDLKFKLKTANPALDNKIKTALTAETKKVSVKKKVPASDVLYLRKLAITKLGELEELDLLLKLVEDFKTADREIAATTFTAIIDLAAKSRQEPETLLNIFQALGSAQNSQELNQDDKTRLASQLSYFIETVFDLDTCTGMFANKSSFDPKNEEMVLRLLDWNYTLLHNYAALLPLPDSDTVSKNLAAIAALGFSPETGSKAAVARKSRALLASISPLYALEQTLDRALADLAAKSADFDYALEAFSFFAGKPFPTDKAEAANNGNSLPTPPTSDSKAVLAKVLKLATAVSAAEMQKEHRDAAYGTLIEIAPVEFARTVVERAAQCGNDDKAALEFLSLLKAAIALPPVIANKELSGKLRAELAGFAAIPALKVLDAAASLLLDDSPEKLLTGLEKAIDSMASPEPEIVSRLSETYMTVLMKLGKKPAASGKQLNLPRFTILLKRSNEKTRKQLLRFVAEREQETVVKLLHAVLTDSKLTISSRDRVFFAEALADFLVKTTAKLSEDSVRTAVQDLCSYISAEANEEYVLHIAGILTSVNHPLASEAVKEMQASGTKRFESLNALLEAVVRRRS